VSVPSTSSPGYDRHAAGQEAHDGDTAFAITLADILKRAHRAIERDSRILKIEPPFRQGPIALRGIVG
jgi:hypothetical protein